MDLILDLLDKQLLDRSKTKIGKIDGLVATFGKTQPRVTAIETGAITLARRSGLARLMLRLFHGRDRAVFRIPWTKVKDVYRCRSRYHPGGNGDA